MPRAPDDLVSLSRLDVRLAPDASSYVQSTSIRPVPGKRSIRRDVRWQREYKHLGGGTFGQVYLEKCMEAGRKEEKRATKRIEKAGRIDYERELEALAVLSYKDEYRDFFVDFLGWYDTAVHVCIVMQYYELGSLEGYLAPAHDRLVEPEVKSIIEQVVKALEYMHALKFMHRDLKPANVLVVTTGPQWWVKVADFGFSKRAISDHVAAHTGGGTPLYMAPEMQGVFENGTYIRSPEVSYTKAVDVWAVGVMTFRMLTGSALFRSGDIDKYLTGDLAFPAEQLRQAAASDEACYFVRSLTMAQPNLRPEAGECLQYPWLQPHTILKCTPSAGLHADEPQEVSGTWTSAQGPRAEPPKYTLPPSEIAYLDVANHTAIPTVFHPRIAPKVRRDDSATGVDDAVLEAAKLIAPERFFEYTTPHRADVSDLSSDSMGDARFHSCNEDHSTQSQSQRHPLPLRNSSTSSNLSKLSTTSYRQGTEPADRERDTSEVSSPSVRDRRQPRKSRSAQRSCIRPTSQRKPGSRTSRRQPMEYQRSPEESTANGTSPYGRMDRFGGTARDYTSRHQEGSKRYQASSRQVFLVQKPHKDAVKSLKPREGRPLVTARQDPVKLRPTNYDEEQTLRREFSRGRRRHDNRTSSTNGDVALRPNPHRDKTPRQGTGRTGPLPKVFSDDEFVRVGRHLSGTEVFIDSKRSRSPRSSPEPVELWQRGYSYHKDYRTGLGIRVQNDREPRQATDSCEPDFEHYADYRSYKTPNPTATSDSEYRPSALSTLDEQSTLRTMDLDNLYTPYRLQNMPQTRASAAFRRNSSLSPNGSSFTDEADGDDAHQSFHSTTNSAADGKRRLSELLPKKIIAKLMRKDSAGSTGNDMGEGSTIAHAKHNDPNGSSVGGGKDVFLLAPAYQMLLR